MCYKINNTSVWIIYDFMLPSILLHYGPVNKAKPYTHKYAADFLGDIKFMIQTESSLLLINEHRPTWDIFYTFTGFHSSSLGYQRIKND